jgi:hypothetical protein
MRRKVGHRKIDTMVFKVKNELYHLDLYLCSDYEVEAEHKETDFRIKTPNVHTLRDAAQKHFEYVQGVKWDALLLIEYKCGSQYSTTEKGVNIEFSWEPILSRPRYNVDYSYDKSKKCYKRNDGSGQNWTSPLRKVEDRDQIVTTVADTPENREKLQAFEDALKNTAQRIHKFLRPDNIQQALSAMSLQKLLPDAK